MFLLKHHKGLRVYPLEHIAFSGPCISSMSLEKEIKKTRDRTKQCMPHPDTYRNEVASSRVLRLPTAREEQKETRLRRKLENRKAKADCAKARKHSQHWSACVSACCIWGPAEGNKTEIGCLGFGWETDSKLGAALSADSPLAWRKLIFPWVEWRMGNRQGISLRKRYVLSGTLRASPQGNVP